MICAPQMKRGAKGECGLRCHKQNRELRSRQGFRKGEMRVKREESGDMDTVRKKKRSQRDVEMDSK